MNENTPRTLRWTIRLLSAVLLLLFVWLEGFVVADIDSLPGPDRAALLESSVDADLSERSKDLQLQIIKLEARVAQLEELKGNRTEARNSADATLRQFTEQHRFELEQGNQPSEVLVGALDAARTSFLEASRSFEEANAQVASLQQQLNELRGERDSLEERIADQRKLGQEEFQELWETHRYKVAALKLVFVVPLFLLAAQQSSRRRGTLLEPFTRALLLASFWWIGVVMHQHFPADFFKYIAILAAIAIVSVGLMRSLRTASRPRPDVKLRRRREAYEHHRCPECAYPVPEETGEAMSCAACGVDLFVACESCGKIRHALLPHCRHCGAESGRWLEGAGEPTPA